MMNLKFLTIGTGLFFMTWTACTSADNNQEVEVLPPSTSQVDAKDPGSSIPAFQMQDAANNVVSLESLKGKKLLVNLWASWCPPCKKMEPVLEKLEKEHGTKFTLLKIDGGAQSELCSSLQINAFPTFILYKNGKQVWRKEGIVEIDELINQL